VATAASGNRKHDFMEQAEDYPVDPATVHLDQDAAQKAVTVHMAQDWPSGPVCRNCGERWPCRLARWGVNVLLAGEWSHEDITKLVEHAKAGDVPWV